MGSTDLVFLILGLGNGAVYAALGLGLVLTYRSSGVVNFATGAVALYTAYTYAFLRQGKLLNPIPGLTATVDLGIDGMGFPAAFALSLVVAAVLGALLYAAVFRPMRAAPTVAKAVASIGVMIVMQALLAVQVGTTAVSVAAILPTRIYTVAGQRVPGDRLWFAGIIVVMAVVLTLWFRLTRFGLATRAAAESEKGALVTGLSPQRIALVNWALSTMIAGVGGILIAPIVPLTPVSYTLFIVPALATALVGNFTRIGTAVTAGLVIGMLQSEATNLQTKSWLPSSGLAELVPLAVILIFLVFRGQTLPSRGSIVQQTLGRAPRPRSMVLPGVTIAAVGFVALAATHGSHRAAIITTIVLAIIALSQVVVTGFSGQISLAQLTLAGVGAFALTRVQHQLHVPFPVAPLLAAVFATIVGVVVGLPALRIRGLPVAVTTLALAVVLEKLWFTNKDLNGGFNGSPIDDPSIFGVNLGIGAGAGYPRLTFGLFCLVVLLLVAGGVVLLRRSRLGAAMLAVRANERSAAASGISVSQVKLVAFAIGGFLAGLGGAMLAYQQTVADSSSYTAMGCVALFATAYLAGVTSVSGGINAGLIGAGGIIFTLVDKGLPLGVYVLLVGLPVLAIVAETRPKLIPALSGVLGVLTLAAFLLHRDSVALGDYYTTVSGVLLVLTVILNPEGIVGPVHDHLGALRTRLGRRSPVALPTPSGDAAAGGAAAAAFELSVRRGPHEVTAGPLLRVSGVGVRYGAVVANQDVSFDVNRGEIIGLIGPNGAGKTTLIDAISGYADATGSIEFLGRRLDGLRPHQRSRRGLGRTFQGIELYDDLSARENVQTGTMADRSSGDGATPSHVDIDRLFAILHLETVADAPVRELSVGQRQLVSVARALAGRPAIVLLDEPAAGLDTTESRWLGERLRAIRDAGVTIVMVDHDMGLVLDVCDRIVVLNLGEVVVVGTPAEIQRDPEVTRAYLGTTHAHTEHGHAEHGHTGQEQAEQGHAERVHAEEVR
ncbi:branched-chain amino acid ABC transporter permease/ATP-binding protein [Parafrankia discariae]|uniref:branched-chain amino acid ABC transporter permease/ATP-binding protein n=1 Tax=Parafrankia discariae TaxID=365528 RepID=UPI00036E04FB|nr:branched-chain amino acid ABC transporter permease/ATP-binding protein [Parafrankia discariae]